MDANHPGLARIVLVALVVAGAPAATSCRRDDRGAARGGDAGSGAVFTLDAPGPPGAPSPPPVVAFGSRAAGVAWVVQRADALHVLLDGKPGRAVTAVDQIAVSPDGRRIAYGAQVDGDWRMVVDDELGVPSSAVDEPVFSPDSRHVAYFATAAAAGDTRRVVVDRTEGPACREAVGAPVFSADSTLVAFAEVLDDGAPARLAVSDLSLAQVTVRLTGVKQFVANEAGTALAAVVEGEGGERVAVLPFSRAGAAKEGSPYDAVSNLALGPDGAAVAYVAEKGGRRVLVVGEAESPLPGAQGHDEIAELAVAADGRSTAFCARRGEAWFVVVNGREGPPFDRVVSPAFSPDGKALVYRARKDGKRFVVVADASGGTVRRLPDHEQVFPVRFTAGGKAIAYGVKDGRQLAWRVAPL